MMGLYAMQSHVCILTDDIAEESELEAWLEDEEQKRSSALRWCTSKCDSRSLTDLLHTGHLYKACMYGPVR